MEHLQIRRDASGRAAAGRGVRRVRFSRLFQDDGHPARPRPRLRRARRGHAARCVIVVNENFVQELPRRPATRSAQRVVGNGNMTFEIVGVVKDSASIGLRDLDQHMLYVPGGRGVLHVRAVGAAGVADGRHRGGGAPPRSGRPGVQRAHHRAADRSIRCGSERTFAMLSSTFGAARAGAVGGRSLRSDRATRSAGGPGSWESGWRSAPRPAASSPSSCGRPDCCWRSASPLEFPAPMPLAGRSAVSCTKSSLAIGEASQAR